MIWPLVQLGDVAPAKASKHTFAETDDVWTLNLDQIEADTGKVLQKIIAPASEAGSSTHGFDERHVLYSKLRPYLNKVVLPNDKGLATTELVPMLPDADRLERKYLAYYLRSKGFVDWVSAQVAGAKMPRVSMQLFWQHEIPLPPLSEQKRIAAILDKADAIRRKRQQAIQLADDFLRAVFLDMFGDPVTNPKGWMVRPLGELAKSFQNGIGKGKEYYGSGEKVANISDLYRAAKFAPEEYSLLDVSLEEVAKYRLARGDLLFVRSSVKREGVAYCSMYDSDEVCLFGSFMIRMIVDDLKVLPEFLSLQLRMPSQRICLVNASNTATITNISQDGLSGIEVVVPPISEQRAFLNKHKSILEVLRKKSCFHDQSNNIFSSLSQKAFSVQL